MHLPHPASPLFGRRRSLALVERALRTHRVVTITGVGGVGKTRLAVQAADEIAPKVAERVGWVQLAPVSDPELVATFVCGALDIRLSASLSPIEALVRKFRRTPWLLILDNCEHVLGACADLVLQLIESCPQLRVLATSREALAIAGEALCPVSPLTVPEESHGSDPGKVLESSAVQLFVDRVRAAQPGFAVEQENAAAVARLCRRLDGIPLALELAAARVGALTPAQIVDRLDDGIDLLKRSGRQAPPRHQTMRAAIDWSHALLTEAERILFRRLAVFAGHADIEACEAVCSDDELGPSKVLDLLTGLIEKSLVSVHEQDGRARYRLLEPIRQFAQERLVEAAELLPLRGRLARYYADRAQGLAASLHGPDRAAALQALERDHDNLRLAWDHAVDAADAALVARLAGAIFWFWNFRGHLIEGRRRAEQALKMLGKEAGRAGPLLHVAGALAWMQGDYEIARERLEACANMRENGHGRKLRGIARRELAGVLFAAGDLSGAAGHYDAAIEILRETGDDWDLALALVMQAEVRGCAGEPEIARRLLEEAREVFAEAADPWGLSLACFGLGWAAASAGDLDGAKEQLGKALALQREAGDPWNTGQFLVLLGEVAEQAGDDEAAARRYREALSAFREVGDRVSTVHGIVRSASIERRQGRFRHATRLLAAAEARAVEPDAAYVYALASNEGPEAIADALCQQLGEAAFQAEWTAGQSLSLDEAVATVVDPPDGDGGSWPARDVVAEQARLQLFAFGRSKVVRDGRSLRAADWGFALPRELLYYLLAEGPRSKAQIGLDFWPDASEGQLKGRFRTTLYQLRRAVGGTEWVRYRDGRYAFNRDLDYWFDCEAFGSALERAAGTPDLESQAGELQHAIDLYRGDFLEDLPARPWAEPHRQRLRKRFRDALMALGGLRTQCEAHDHAAQLYRRAVELDELDEPARCALANALSQLGDRAGALRQLDALAERLGDELGAEPSRETQDLRARLQNPE